ncbi:unnamed protein product [Citrullus colocynthis]|uniref:Uncharacterized protein n=1 Tax=Citrullus colocynthis TaxID=252529 RepID=A0ABP0YZS3_9ROSI
MNFSGERWPKRDFRSPLGDEQRGFRNGRRLLARGIGGVGLGISCHTGSTLSTANALSTSSSKPHLTHSLGYNPLFILILMHQLGHSLLKCLVCPQLKQIFDPL